MERQRVSPGFALRSTWATECPGPEQCSRSEGEKYIIPKYPARCLRVASRTVTNENVQAARGRAKHWVPQDFRGAMLTPSFMRPYSRGECIWQAMRGTNVLQCCLTADKGHKLNNRECVPKALVSKMRLLHAQYSVEWFWGFSEGSDSIPAWVTGYISSLVATIPNRVLIPPAVCSLRWDRSQNQHRGTWRTSTSRVRGQLPVISMRL